MRTYVPCQPRMNSVSSFSVNGGENGKMLAEVQDLRSLPTQNWMQGDWSMATDQMLWQPPQMML